MSSDCVSRQEPSERAKDKTLFAFSFEQHRALSFHQEENTSWKSPSRFLPESSQART